MERPRAIARGTTTAVVIVALGVAVALGAYVFTAPHPIYCCTTSIQLLPTTSTTTSASSTMTSVSNSSDHIQFSLQLVHDSNGSLTVKVDETNLLDSVNNITGTNGWKYGPYSLNPFDDCAPDLFDGFGIASGYYGQNNLTSTQTLLRLYDAANGQISCSESIYTHTYSFQPLSDMVTVDPGVQNHQYTTTTSLSVSMSGYWTPSGSSFQQFPRGTYTVIGADQWGNVLLLHFTVGTP